MIFYKEINNLKTQIKKDLIELNDYKISYNNRISLYNTYIDTIELFKDGVAESNKINKEELNSKLAIYKMQIEKIEKNCDILNNLQKDIECLQKLDDNKKELIEQYNKSYKEIKTTYINNTIYEDQLTKNYINALTFDFTKTLEKQKLFYEEKLEKLVNTNNNPLPLIENAEVEINVNVNKLMNVEDNNTLLISEKSGKVYLPYKAEEVIKILNSNKRRYKNIKQVIENIFTRNYSDYKIQFASRYKETMKLTRKKEHFNLIDSIKISVEMMNKNSLHPAVISACKTLGELDYYLECLENDELDQFTNFNIEYELYPTLTKVTE